MDRERDFVVDQPAYLDFIKHGIEPFIKEHHSGGNFKLWPEHYSNIVVNYFEHKNMRNKICFCPRKIDPNLVYKFLASNSSRLNKIHRHDLIEKSN